MSIGLFPLFPQHSGSTSGSVCTAFARCVEATPTRPRVRIIPSFFPDAGYIRAAAARIREARGDGRIDHYLFSFHGLPQSHVDRGDPYRVHCETTVRLLVRELWLAEGSWSLAFQSRFGSQPWLRPDAYQRVPALAGTAPSVLVAMPGFAADCLETLEEVGIRLRDASHRAGGERFIVVPALDDHPLWIRAMADLVHASIESSEPA